MNEPREIIGRETPALGAAEIVTGRARFCPDLRLPGLLVGKLLYTPCPSARIKAIDVSAARALPGVHAVLTAADIPGENTYFYAPPPDQPVLVQDRARYLGDPLAAVAAESEAAAQAALEAIRVDYDPLPGVYDVEAAMQPDAPQVWPGRSNCFDHLVIHYGDLEAGFAAADVIVENTYTTPLIEHAFLETEGALAYLDADGVMVVYASCQAPHRDRMQIARTLAVPENRVRVITPYVGGAFGGKDEITVQIHAALLAKAAGRPVRIIRSREESILTHVKRHRTVIRYRSGARRDGRLTAVQVTVIGDAGPYNNSTREVIGLAAVTAGGAYRIPSARLEAISVYTNNPIGGAMRGFGVPQSTFACEAQMDALARALGMDPLEIRTVNGLETGDILPTGQAVREGRGMKACMFKAAELSGWRSRSAVERAPAPHLRRGWGMANVAFSIGMGRSTPDHAGATLQMAADGSVLLYSGASDMGQGTLTALAQIAAEALGVTLDAVRVVRPDTQQTFDAGASVASRQTFISGNAVLRAAEPIRRSLLETAAEQVGLPVELLSLRAGRLYAEGEQLAVTAADLAAKASESNRRLHADGFYAMEYPDPLPPDGYPYAPAVYSFGAQIAQVLVDLETGQIKIEKLVAVHDPGKVINPRGALGQIEGSCTMGAGYALLEELLVDQGRILNRSFDSYLIPTALDAPPIEAALLEHAEPYAPFGAKGIGEPPVSPTAPAILNAVADAIGAPLTEIPLTPERVLSAIDRFHAGAGSD